MLESRIQTAGRSLVTPPPPRCIAMDPMSSAHLPLEPSDFEVDFSPTGFWSLIDSPWLRGRGAHYWILHTLLPQWEKALKPWTT